MRIQNGRFTVLLVVLATVFAAACSDSGDPVAPDPGPGSVPDSVQYSKHVQPVFTSRCATSGCQAQPSPRAGLDLTAGVSYDNIVNVPTDVFTPGVRVTPGNPAQSVLYLLVESGQMPASGPNLSSVQVAILRTWIEDGAPDN